MTRGSEDAVMVNGVERFAFGAEGFDDLIRSRDSPLRCSFKRREQKWCGVVKRSFRVGKREFFLAADGMPADGVEAFGQFCHRFDHQSFCRTQVHDDAGVGCERWQLFKQSQNRRDGRRQDDKVNFGEQLGRITVSVIHDVLGQSKLERGRMRVDSIENRTFAA